MICACNLHSAQFLHVQALEAIARPFPTLFCACLVSEALRAAAQSAKSSIRRSLGWDRQAASATLADLADNRAVTAARDCRFEHDLEGRACLFKAAAVAQQCFPAAAAAEQVLHQHSPLGMQLRSTSFAEANSSSRQQPLGLSFGYLSPHVHHIRHLHSAGSLSAPHASTVKHALLAGQSPFVLFAGQPSTEMWLKLMHALQAQTEEDLVLDQPHSILLTRRASAGSIARQQAVMHRATIQQQRPAAA